MLLLSPHSCRGIGAKPSAHRPSTVFRLVREREIEQPEPGVRSEPSREPGLTHIEHQRVEVRDELLAQPTRVNGVVVPLGHADQLPTESVQEREIALHSELLPAVRQLDDPPLLVLEPRLDLLVRPAPDAVHRPQHGLAVPRPTVHPAAQSTRCVAVRLDHPAAVALVPCHLRLVAALLRGLRQRVVVLGRLGAWSTAARVLLQHHRLAGLPFFDQRGFRVQEPRDVERVAPGRDVRLHEVVMALGIALIVCAGIAADEADAREQLELSLSSGRALQLFDQMIKDLGGPSAFSDTADTHLPSAPVIQAVPSLADGYIGAIDTRMLGMAVVSLGGGRSHPNDRVDPTVGFDQILRIGQKVSLGDPLCRVHAADVSAAEHAAATVQAAMHIGSNPEAPVSAVLEKVA